MEIIMYQAYNAHTIHKCSIRHIQVYIMYVISLKYSHKPPFAANPFFFLSYFFSYSHNMRLFPYKNASATLPIDVFTCQECFFCYFYVVEEENKYFFISFHIFRLFIINCKFTTNHQKL